MLAMALGGPAIAADVVSPHPDQVAVTIYRDQPMSAAQLVALGDGDTHGLALVVETRAVDLPAGRSRLRFDGVSDAIVPQSAGVEGLPAAIIERDFDYDLLTPATLLARSQGAAVTLVRTNPRTGKQTREAAVIRAAPDGVVLEVGGHVEALGCGGETERLVFDRAPAGLAARPALSLAVNAPAAGHFVVRLSYLAVRMDWTADYVARLAPDGRSLALTGWITLANRSDTAFADAPTDVVAGNLARVPVDIPEARPAPREAACWPGQTTHAGWIEPMQAEPAMARAFAMAAPAPGALITVTARKQAIESALGDYKLYTLPEPTTVAARQTKQVLFLDQPDVRFETIYAHTIEGFGADRAERSGPADVVLRLRNTKVDGLGVSLPAGAFQVRQEPSGLAAGALQLGERRLDRDVPVGEPFELGLGAAPSVAIDERLTAETIPAHGRIRRDIEVHVTNGRSTPVVVEIRHDRAGAAGFTVVAETDPHVAKAGDPLWRFFLPAGGWRTLTYTVEFAQR